MNNRDEWSAPLEWSATLEMTEESSSNLLQMLEQHDKEFIEGLFDGKKELRLILGEKEVLLAPVKKRGTWSDISGQACLCSVCGRPQNYKQAMGWKYCPCCGAKMQEVEKNE